MTLIMIACFDVQYAPQGSGAAAALVFGDFDAPAPTSCYTHVVQHVEAYVPGQVFRRELPCLLALYERIKEPLKVMIIDGYVNHAEGAGLGQHLFASCDGRIPVIGVAKSEYADATGIKILRGASQRPLYVTAAGMNPEAAADSIRRMHGRHRIPTLLKQVDRLARQTAREVVESHPSIED